MKMFWNKRKKVFGVRMLLSSRYVYLSLIKSDCVWFSNTLWKHDFIRYSPALSCYTRCGFTLNTILSDYHEEIDIQTDRKTDTQRKQILCICLNLMWILHSNDMQTLLTVLNVQPYSHYKLRTFFSNLIIRLDLESLLISWIAFISLTNHFCGENFSFSFNFYFYTFITFQNLRIFSNEDKNEFHSKFLNVLSFFQVNLRTFQNVHFVTMSWL